uniref:Uncharacterized protein n=1 Tax=Trichobilharzia regenti TaxID=157069 RepID=A0AA85KHA8_TRIRE|nr:unnamed protein product [Trichobilharzia regenti]
MVLSKLDNCDISKLGGLEFFRKSSEFRKIPVIETSAHENINIEEAFLTLFKLMESKVCISKFKHTPYLDAVNKRAEEIQSAMHAFIRLLLLSLPEFLTDWDSFMARYSHHTDVVNYINLVSSSNARRKFETVVQERLRTAKLHSLDRVPGLLMHLLPNLDAVHGFSFEQIVSHVRHHEDFSLYFQDDAYNDCENRVNASCCCPLRNDTRVPFHLAIQPTAESENSPLKEHVDLLTNMRRHHTEKAFLETALHHGFLTLPASCQSGEFSKDITIILPGQPLSDVKANISSLNLPTLTKGEISMVYKQFQLGLHTRVREDFLDLLVEKTGLFIKAVVGYLIYSENSPYFSLPPIISNEHSNELFPEVTSDLLPSMTTQLPMLQNISDDQNKHYVAPPKGVKETQITWLGEQLSVDTRYQAMTYLPSERQTLITSYFDMLFPTIDSHWLISKSINNDVFTTDSGGVQNPRNSTMSNDMDSPVADNLASIDPKMECSSESSNQQYFQPELPSLYSLCPSISWGGCMDFFFKRFVYEYLSTNCNCFKYQFGSCCDSSGICICMNKRVSFKSNLPHNYSISYLPSLTTDQPPLILSIAVACICTDTLAARAIINLLSCAGFCTLPLNSKACKYSSTHCLNHKYHQCDHVKSLITSTAKMINSPDPLVLGATWPLPTTRLFLSNSSSCTNTPVVELCKDICYGEVRVDFMSHHSLSSKLLSHREEFVSKCEQLDDVLKESKSNSQLTIRIYHILE